jgi:IS5 family transposase
LSGFELIIKKICQRELLEEMNLAVPWIDLTGFLKPFALARKTGHPPFSIATMLSIHIMQKLFGLSHHAMEDQLHDMSLFHELGHFCAG